MCKDPDLPSKNSWFRYLKKHPGMEEKYRQTIYSQPYHMQFKTGFLSPRLLDDFKRMKASGMSITEIAENMGVKGKLIGRIGSKDPAEYK